MIRLPLDSATFPARHCHRDRRARWMAASSLSKNAYLPSNRGALWHQKKLAIDGLEDGGILKGYGQWIFSTTSENKGRLLLKICPVPSLWMHLASTCAKR